MAKKIGLGAGAALLLLVIVIVTRPAEYRVERSLTVAAPPEIVFSQVNDFQRWVAWSPWEKLDPNMKKRFGGASSGVGATYAWEGNDQVGQGSMTITESRAPQRIGIELAFLAPWESTSQAAFTFAPVAEGTKVTWAMTGHNDFAGKAFGLFMDMDAMIGADFEKGLAAMKTVAEAGASKPGPSP